jgi:hypothetical protein
MYERGKALWNHKEWISTDEILTTGTGGSVNEKKKMYYISGINSNNTWVSETIDNIQHMTYTIDLDGEITVKFGYVPN